MPCPEEIDYSYVKMPPITEKGISWVDARVVTCRVNYDMPRDCSACNDYHHCDVKGRTVVEGKKWTPPMRSRSEIETAIKGLSEGRRLIDTWSPEEQILREGEIRALKWVIGQDEEVSK